MPSSQTAGQPVSFGTFLRVLMRRGYLSTKTRWKRLIGHILWIRSWNLLPAKHPLIWIGDLGCYLVDIFYLPEILDVFLFFAVSRLRYMDREEMELARSFFSRSVDLSLIFVNDHAKIFTKNFAHAYVSFQMIHFDKEIEPSIFVHEMVHVWQFQCFGTVYLFRAMLAQMSREGYDYGGFPAVREGSEVQISFLKYNFEQQAEIIEDYYKIQSHPLYKLDRDLVFSYRYFFKQLEQISRKMGVIHFYSDHLNKNRRDAV